METRDKKKEIRKHIRELKKSFTQEQRDKISFTIENNLLQLTEISEAKTILLYYSLPDEVSTEFLLEKLSNHRGGDKIIILPVVCGDDLILKEYVPQNISSGYQNIMEPDSGADINPAQIDFAVIPGMAFDDKCNRMGRGKGFYDRLMPSLKCKKCGLAFDFQIVESVPCEEFDIPLDIIVTETKKIARKD